MVRSTISACVLFGCVAAGAAGQGAGGAQAGSRLTIPQGTEVGLVVLRAVYAQTVKPGEPVYLQVSFPVVVDDRVGIPAGSFVLAHLVSVVKPTRKSSHAQAALALDKLILPSGYALELHETQTMDVQVSASSDLLLDNGTQARITLAEPLRVDASRVAASLALARPVKPGSMRTGTRCRPTEGSPGTPGTPGTPDTTIPGTPDTVIPGVNGAPDTVIPGTPATVIPGTPASLGSPDTPGTVCPNAPLVLSSKGRATANVAATEVKP